MICPYYTRALYGARAMLVPIRMGTVRTMGNNMPTCRPEPTETSVTEIVKNAWIHLLRNSIKNITPTLK